MKTKVQRRIDWLVREKYALQRRIKQLLRERAGEPAIHQEKRRALRIIKKEQ